MKNATLRNDRQKSTINDMSVLLPAYNEELTIGSVIDEALAEGVTPAHILVGDNCSTDRTAEIATGKGVAVYTISNRGKGNVIHELVKHIETDYALVADSDSTYPLKGNVRVIRRMLRIYGAVLTYRIPSDGAMSLLHKVGNTGLSLIASVLYRTRIRDVVSGMWGFRTELINDVDIEPGGFTPDVDFVTGVMKIGARICRIPISYGVRPDGSKPKLHASHGVVIAIRIVKRRIRR